ncbi:hypothetical protein D3C84_621460 [compost metagenome]
MTADDFRDGTGFKVRVARIFTLGRIDQEDGFADYQAAFLHTRQQLFFGGAWIGGAFQRNDLTGTQVRFECVGGVDHEAHIRLAVFIQRRRHAENQSIALADTAEIGSGLEAALAGSRDFVSGDMLDIALTGVELAHLAFINVYTQHTKANSVVAQHQG